MIKGWNYRMVRGEGVEIMEIMEMMGIMKIMCVNTPAPVPMHF